MATASEADQADTPTPDKTIAGPGAKTKHTLVLRFATLYLLEGILQQPGPCTTPDKVVKWAKAWEKVRRAFPHRFEASGRSYNVDKNIIKDEAETDLAWVTRQQAYFDAKEQWEEQKATIVVNDKLRDIFRDAVKWIQDHRDDAKVGIKIGGQYASELMVALGLADPLKDDEFELDVE